MKTILLLVSVALAARADRIIPNSFDKGRYAETIRKSPFVETKVDVTEPPLKPPTKLILRGITKTDGKDYVLLQRPGEERAIRLIGTEPGVDQLAVKSVKVGNSFRETRVTLMNGLEMSEVGFKEDTLSAPPAPGKGPGSRPPTPTTGMNPTVPRPPVAIPTPASIPQASGASRQRLRVINN